MHSMVRLCKHMVLCATTTWTSMKVCTGTVYFNLSLTFIVTAPVPQPKMYGFYIVQAKLPMSISPCERKLRYMLSLA